MNFLPLPQGQGSLRPVRFHTSFAIVEAEATAVAVWVGEPF